MSKALLTWYDSVKRDLPWRENVVPYKIWISEIMLQQTQVVTVIDYFNRFINKYPDIFALAQADESDVFKLWEGLGYYSRAKNLIRCARRLVEESEGVFPESIEALQKLPGIGPYTAGAIASIAFDQKVPAVDGNVLRVVSRLDCIDLPIGNSKNLTVFKEHTMALMTDRPGDFNQALMELGATVCTPKNPKCHMCPLSMNCQAYELKIQEQFPNKPPSLKKREIQLGILILVDKGQVLITKNPTEGLLANLWGFPKVELNQESAHEDQVSRWIEENYGIKAQIIMKRDGKQHIFTHLKWKPILFFLYVSDKLFIEFPIIEWTSLEGLNTKALPTAFTKQIGLIEEGLENMNSEG